MITKNPVKLFLLYTLPAVDDCVQQEKRTEVRSRLEDCIAGRAKISKKEIGTIFPSALKRMQEFARRIGAKNWSLEAVRGYWRLGHNLLDIPEECKTKFGVVREINEEGGYRTAICILQDEERKVIVPAYHPEINEIKSGDYISIHKGHVAEVIR